MIDLGRALGNCYDIIDNKGVKDIYLEALHEVVDTLEEISDNLIRENAHLIEKK